MKIITYGELTVVTTSLGCITGFAADAFLLAVTTIIVRSPVPIFSLYFTQEGCNIGSNIGIFAINTLSYVVHSEQYILINNNIATDLNCTNQLHE